MIRVLTIARGTTRRLFQQALTLVEANRFHADPGFACNLSNRKGIHLCCSSRRTIHPVPYYRVKRKRVESSELRGGFGTRPILPIFASLSCACSSLSIYSPPSQQFRLQRF